MLRQTRHLAAETSVFLNIAVIRLICMIALCIQWILYFGATLGTERVGALVLTRSC